MGKGTDLNRILNAVKNAEDAANYEEALVLDAELNSGTDYTLVWTEAYEGLWPLEQHKVEV